MTIKLVLRNCDRLLITCMLLWACASTLAQSSLGSIRNNTNPALPNSYDFQEYVFAEPEDQGNCIGSNNSSSVIEEVFFAQTHRNFPSHPLFFMIGHRPALLQVAITGSGASPDVTVSGTLNGNSLGSLCLKGPSNLPSRIELSTPDFDNYFSITLPKSWIQDGLSLVISTGGATRTITSQELKIGPYCEMNLVMVNQDVMDYNTGPHNNPIFDDFLEELASSIPASVIRFGIFPETLTYPEVIASKDEETLVRLQGRGQVANDPVLDDGYINSIAVLGLGNLHQSTQDFVSTVYFGNTLNLAPGGWGGGKNFVSLDYTNIFIHELGHALSLPHWGGDFNITNPSDYEFNYPFGGDTGNGGGRGSTWNFIQDTYEFVSPICQGGSNGRAGEERSDCMQRNNACLESRPSGNGPWDGHGVFSANAMHRYLTGAAVESGQVLDRGEMRNFQFPKQSGFPNMTLENNKRTYTRASQQPQVQLYEERFEMPGDEILNTDVHLIYGTVHPTQMQANIVYCPVKYNGTLPPIIDPTNATTFDLIKNASYSQFLYETRDITIKVTYIDGSILHAINPYHTFTRPPYLGDFGRWRNDLSNFSLVVPGDKEIAKVEVFNRPFCVRGASDAIDGNINYAPHNITAANFMNSAGKLTEYDINQPKLLGSGAIGNRVWHDYDRDGINDPNEPGIAAVELVLWGDSDGNNVPDGNAFMGTTKTDANGYYRWGVGEGNFTTFVWQLNNWNQGEPLHGFVSTNNHVADPNTNIDLDNNASGLPFTDIFSGTITITNGDEPLNDGDGSDCWYNYDPSGNMTIDFGFYNPGLFVWTGDDNDDWMTASNWAGGVIPDATSDVIILSGRSFYPDIDETIKIKKLEIQSGARIKIPFDLNFEVITSPSNFRDNTHRAKYNSRDELNKTKGHQHDLNCEHESYNEYLKKMGRTR